VTSEAERRARRLLRWYPRSWRARYGEEFTELLLAEMAEQPRNWRQAADVAANGLVARCTLTGLTSHDLAPAEQVRAGLATLGCALTAVVAFGMFMLAQLATGWQWTRAGSASTAIGTLVMAASAAALALAALAAAVPVGWHAAVAAVRRTSPRWPAVVALVCAVVLVAGARHLENGWPGTGGLGPEHGLVPGGLAAFGWAATLSVSAYWAHPALWGSFPAPELAWMVLSPVTWIGLVTGCVAVVRRLALPNGLLRYLARVGAVATFAAVGFLAGAATWVLARSPDQPGLFRPGLVDVVSLLIMAGASVVALRAAERIRQVRLAQ
jgi:hypothetical protein